MIEVVFESGPSDLIADRRRDHPDFTFNSGNILPQQGQVAWEWLKRIDVAIPRQKCVEALYGQADIGADIEDHFAGRYKRLPPIFDFRFKGPNTH